jgi:hypothetical protein
LWTRPWDAQQADPAVDGSGLPAAYHAVLWGSAVDCLAQVGVAKSVDEKLGATDGAQQVEVIR